MRIVKLSSDGCRLMQCGTYDKRLRDRIDLSDSISETKTPVRLERKGRPLVFEVPGRVERKINEERQIQWR